MVIESVRIYLYGYVVYILHSCIYIIFKENLYNQKGYDEKVNRKQNIKKINNVLNYTKNNIFTSISHPCMEIILALN